MFSIKTKEKNSIDEEKEEFDLMKNRENIDLVCVIDKSGSMNDFGKLGLVKNTLL